MIQDLKVLPDFLSFLPHLASHAHLAWAPGIEVAALGRIDRTLDILSRMIHFLGDFGMETGESRASA